MGNSFVEVLSQICRSFPGHGMDLTTNVVYHRKGSSSCYRKRRTILRSTGCGFGANERPPWMWMRTLIRLLLLPASIQPWFSSCVNLSHSVLHDPWSNTEVPRIFSSMGDFDLLVHTAHFIHPPSLMSFHPKYCVPPHLRVKETQLSHSRNRTRQHPRWIFRFRCAGGW